MQSESYFTVILKKSCWHLLCVRIL